MFRTIYNYFFPKKTGTAVTLFVKKTRSKELQANLVRLRMKIKRHAAEVAILKREQKYCRKNFLPDLERHIAHQLHTTRAEQRCQFIAYAYLRRQTYDQVEENARWKRGEVCAVQPNWKRVIVLVIRYGEYDYDVDIPGKIIEEVTEEIKVWAS